MCAARLPIETDAIARDAAWREQICDERPILGRLAALLTPKPKLTPESQPTRAWAQGALGEQRVAEVLGACAGVVCLHDRKVPGSKSNVDHIAVGPSGVFVIDAKRYMGAVEKRSGGRLFVGGRNRTKLVDGMAWQVDAVRAALAATGADADTPAPPVHPLLCFVGADWPLLFARPLHLRGVTVLWPARLIEVVQTPGALDEAQIGRVASALAAALPPA